MIIYISGSITNNPHFLEEFSKAEELLKAKGYEVINPARTNATLPPLKHSDYMKVCRPLVEISDCIYMLKGWEHSKGAIMERDWAEEFNKKVIYENKEIL